ERPGGVEIYNEFEFGRLQHRKVSGPCTFENPGGVAAELPILIGKVDSIADQATCYRILALHINGGNRVACRQCDHLFATRDKEDIGADDDRTRSPFDDVGEGCLNFTFISGVEDQ